MHDTASCSLTGLLVACSALVEASGGVGIWKASWAMSGVGGLRRPIELPSYPPLLPFSST